MASDWITLKCVCRAETTKSAAYILSEPFPGASCGACGTWIEYRDETPASVIGEAVLADSVRTDAPRAPTFADMVVAPDPYAPLSNLLDQWSRGGFTLPLDSAQRKLVPLQSGNYDYFPAAHAAIAAWSYINNQKHNPGQPLHWSQAKSNDHRDCIARHTLDIGDADGDDAAQLIELTARAWRALAELQMFAQAQGAPVPPGAKVKP
jgi:hypothetical protein